MDVFWRMAHRIYKLGGGGRKIARIFEMVSFVIGSHAISAQIEIGNGTQFRHHGCGVVVHEQAVIGKDCTIHQNVTIGAKMSLGEEEDGVPRIGNGVIIGAGAVLIGKINVGDGAVIGANAVVIGNVPNGAVAVGVPAKIKYQK